MEKSGSKAKQFSEMLLSLGLLTEEQLDTVLKQQKTTGEKLIELIVKLGFVSEEVLFTVLAKQFKMQYVSLAEYGEIPKNVLNLIPEKTIRTYCLIPLELNSNILTVVISDPLDIVALDDLKLAVNYEIKTVVARKKEISEMIEKYFSKEESLEKIEKEMQDKLDSEEVEILEEKEENTDIDKEADSAPVVKTVNYLIEQAVNLKASDLLIEPQEKNLRIRFRVDGILQDQPPIPKKLIPPICARVKIMAKLDITEKRKPQDGRIKLTYSGKDLNLRVSTVPTSFGEKITIRVIDSEALCLPLTELGFEEEQLKLFEKTIEQPYGMMLVTGPTGSGKTTTLYSALNVLNHPDVNIMTVEEPVEVVLYSVNQVNVNEKANLTFAAALRSFLRQDPDIIMVGEIRDKETIEIAINAALTGHLVFSTLHTNDASSSVTRLINMNVEPFLIASTLMLVVSQKLIRKVCKHCRESYAVPFEQLQPLGVTSEMVKNVKEVIIYKGKGCSKCNNGYKGRIGIYEVLDVNDKIKDLILKSASHIEIKRTAVQQGMITLRESALKKLLSGMTTVEEVLKNTFADEILE